MFVHLSLRGRTIHFYVDDMIITVDNRVHIHHVKTYLQKQFKMKDLELFRYILGMEVVYGPHGYPLSQQNYKPI